MGVAVLCLLVTAAARHAPHSTPGELRVTFLAVGHGDAIVLQLPDGAVILVDGGGDAAGKIDVGERVVVPALEAMGIDRIDVMVLTHPDADHFLGLLAVADHLEVGELWTSGRESDLPEYRRLLSMLEAGGTAVHVLGSEPMSWSRAGVDLWLVHPHPPPGSSQAAALARAMAGTNDNSLVLKLQYGDFGLLLTGDIEAAAEKRIVERWGTNLRSTVLKVPHHGSRTSSTETFLDAVAPSLAVVQASDQGRFAFPRPDVEARYRDRGIGLWVTGRHGALQLRSTGREVRLESF